MKREAGAGLVGVLVLIGGMLLVVGALAAYVDHLRVQRELDGLVAERNRVADRVQSQLEMPAALRVTGLKAVNKDLGRCLGFLGGGCTYTTAAKQRPIELYVPFSAASPGEAVAGAPAKPVRYSRRGERADCKPSEACPFEAQAFFWATCPGHAPSCPRAETIHVRRLVRVAPGVTFKSGVKLQSVPRSPDFGANPELGAVEVLVARIREAYTAQCHPGSYLVGLTTKGGIKCQCMAGFEQSGVDPVLGIPFCKNLSLACTQPRAVFMGLDKDQKPICLVIPETEYDCETKLISAKGEAKCDTGARVRALRTSKDCGVDNKTNIVTCPDMAITCCKVK